MLSRGSLRRVAKARTVNRSKASALIVRQTPGGVSRSVGYSSQRGQNCRSTPANAWPVTFVATPQAAA